jgi:hypothetical protein
VPAGGANPLLPSTGLDARPVLPEYADLHVGAVASDLLQLDEGEGELMIFWGWIPIAFFCGWIVGMVQEILLTERTERTERTDSTEEPR